MIQPSFMSRELAHLRALDLLDDAERHRRARAAARPRREARRAAFGSWARRVLAPARPAVVVPAPRAGETADQRQGAAADPAVLAADACP